MKAPLVSFHFAPAGGGGVQRALKLALARSADAIERVAVLLRKAFA